jgi:hypothetical protein
MGNRNLQEVVFGKAVVHNTYKQTKTRKLEYIDYRWKQAIATSRIPRLPSGDIEAEVPALAGKCLGLLL